MAKGPSLSQGSGATWGGGGEGWEREVSRRGSWELPFSGDSGVHEGHTVMVERRSVPNSGVPHKGKKEKSEGAYRVWRGRRRDGRSGGGARSGGLGYPPDGPSSTSRTLAA